MNKQVKLTIEGKQMNAEGNDTIAVDTTAKYSLKKGCHYLRYDEDSTSCTLKLTPDRIDMIKKGSVNSHMVFEAGRTAMTTYNTVYGNFGIGTNTKSITIDETEDALSVVLEYELSMNDANVTVCKLIITAKSE